MTQEILICYDGSNDAGRAIDDELDVAAIVIGSRALHGFRGFARGVSHDVATYARRPVLIVPPVTT